MALQMTLTKAGRAALINAQNTGTNALTISKVGVSATHYAGALANLTALPAELKRISTIGGQVVDDETIHVTIQDTTSDAYALRAFGFYLSDNTLFAAFSAPAPLIDKSAAAMVALGLDIPFTALGAATITVGDLSLSNPPASETVKGVVELATNDETVAGNDASRAVHPKGLKAALQALETIFSAIGHKHSAADINSGKLAADRFLSEIPYADPFTPGLIERASVLQAIEGVGDVAAVTPAGLHAWGASSARSMGVNGYLKIPGTALILQWGRLTATIGEADFTVTFPVTFPTACVLLAGQVNNAAGAADMDLFVQGRGTPGKSSGQLRVNKIGSSPSAARLDWWALGY